jgi:hypothetical protein
LKTWPAWAGFKSVEQTDNKIKTKIKFTSAYQKKTLQRHL